jgi:alginate O-acetyltransferase complex protein AlgI
MAVGTARMIGYELPINFRMPYLSLSVTEFWKRWHITLSEWLRDYLYIPLGGNRRGPARAQLNLLVTMLLGGLWHGASWTFVLWGALHGIALIVHKSWTRAGLRMPMPLAWVTTLTFILATWIPFRATSLVDAGTILSKMCFIDSVGASWSPVSLWISLAACVVGHAIGSLVIADHADWARRRAVLLHAFGMAVDSNPISGRYLWWRTATVAGVYVLALWAATVALFAPLNSSPFIYFQF